MSRSFGDHLAKGVGVIAEPDIFLHQPDINDDYDDCFIVLGSDGLFDFLENETVVSMVSLHFEECENTSGGNKEDLEEICEDLVSRASVEWGLNEPTRDDITCIVIYQR